MTAEELKKYFKEDKRTLQELVNDLVARKGISLSIAKKYFNYKEKKMINEKTGINELPLPFREIAETIQEAIPKFGLRDGVQYYVHLEKEGRKWKLTKIKKGERGKWKLAKIKKGE